ncbi:DUF3299 domain-containing protein [Ruegeria sp. B32]|uniref:DUF3299 domain-containing protein n=1 Tax=Ruegeria sp. B32 TaxID=2867020 RepID=UPI0021A74D00|nr:DUF3299 domain-containing protein [Ruegeria sp. B32]
MMRIRGRGRHDKPAFLNSVRTLLIAATLSLGAGAPSWAGLSIGWDDLPDPTVQTFEDPYRDLSPEQFDDVLFVVRLRGRLQQDVGTDEDHQKWQELLHETEDALAAGGVDVDWLLSQRQVVTERREKAATLGNPLYDGQEVTLSGFAIPAPADADGRSVVYLVPERGMCSHMPPPPPNQMIRVMLDADWVPSYVHEPVRLTGRLTISPTDHQMVVVDGLMPMRATFQLEADKVETLQNRTDGLEWSEDPTDILRAAGRRKTGGQAASE